MDIIEGITFALLFWVIFSAFAHTTSEKRIEKMKEKSQLSQRHKS